MMQRIRNQSKAMKLAIVLFLMVDQFIGVNGAGAISSQAVISNPILFVTQVPIANYTDVTSPFGNHKTRPFYVPRGGDLWIRYPNGHLKNLTQTAGYGLDANNDGILKGDEAISVREPSVSWDGTRALFSMIVGGPTAQWDYVVNYWQIYEISGLGENQTPLITKVPNQPGNYNNVSPIYASDGSIIFTSDRPRNGSALLYPQLDEYEMVESVTGLWKLNPANGDLTLLNHAPSGDFTPLIDSFGRIVFTQWDHLERDQQADYDQEYLHPGTTQCDSKKFGTFNYASENSNAYNPNNRAEVYPEAHSCRTDLNQPLKLSGHLMNFFMPWTINQDGTAGETLNHIGRHEFIRYIDRTFVNDLNLVEYYGQYGDIANTNPVHNGMFQIAEDPNTPGQYYGIDTQDFFVHSTGNIYKIYAPMGLDADQISVTYVTHPDTYGTDPTPNHSGRYRDPLPLANGTLLAVHTPTIGVETKSGVKSIYSFRIQTLTVAANGFMAADQYLTTGISKSVKYWDPYELVVYSGPLWELEPVEVRATSNPQPQSYTLQTPEKQIFNQAGISPAELQDWMKSNNLALVVGHNVTTRDDMDLQQPFNLHIPQGTQTLGSSGKVYDVSYLQLFQADQLRGHIGGSGSTPLPGRRVLAEPLHDPNAALANPSSNGPPGSVTLGSDGSFAAFVPAQRAMTWQLTDQSGTGVVRERYWLSFQPGEIRVCKSCHGVNELDQAGNSEPENPPQALLDLLNGWKVNSIPKITAQASSASALDGWILESSESSNAGGSYNSNTSTLYLGDNKANEQYRSILSFDTSQLPNDAVVTKISLNIKKAGVVGGGNPIKKLKGFLVEIMNGDFGSAVLESNDFNLSGGASLGPFRPPNVGGWYKLDLTQASSLINLLGDTQIRLSFKLDDNNNKTANYLKLYSGNADPSSRPQLSIEYYVP